MERYETWLKRTQEELQAAIAEAENEGWHHAPEPGGSPAGYQHYCRLLAWEAAVADRRRWYDTEARLFDPTRHPVD